MGYIKKSSIFLLTGILVFYIGISISKGTYSTETYSLKFDASLSVDENNKFITNISIDTTVFDFLKNVTVTGTNVTINVYDSSNNIKNANKLLASGDILKIYLNNEIKDQYTLSVTGDSNGDSVLDLIDLVQMRKHIVGWVNPNTNEIQRKTGVYYHSLNFNEDEVIDLIDLVRMRKTIVGIDLEEENKVTYTATFEKNGANSIASYSLICSAYDANGCEITAPVIDDDRTILGWSTNKSSKKADVSVNEKIKLTGNVTYYAITKDTYTATFNNTGLDYIEAKSRSCDVYNAESGCNITLPSFNKSGYFNSFWSPYQEASSDLGDTTWSKKYFNQVGHDYKLTGDVTLYPNFNHLHYDITTRSYYKYRTIDTASYETVGESIFEFEEGIPQTIIDTFIDEMETAYDKFPWLFITGKVFVMTEDTYSEYSIAYGLTHQMYISYGGDSHFTIDLKYDTSANAISVNAALHELGHAWDSHYYFQTGEERISKLDDFDTFYNLINSKLYVDGEGKTISKVETFAGMFTNYYWHVLKMDDSKSYYALKSGEKLNTSELNALKTFMEKYINIAKNGY